MECPKEMYHVPHAFKLCLAYWMQAKETKQAGGLTILVHFVYYAR